MLHVCMFFLLQLVKSVKHKVATGKKYSIISSVRVSRVTVSIRVNSSQVKSIKLYAECLNIFLPVMAFNQSIKIYFLSNRNITVYTVYASAQKAAREAYAH